MAVLYDSDTNNSIRLPISFNGKSCTDDYGCEELTNETLFMLKVTVMHLKLQCMKNQICNIYHIANTEYFIINIKKIKMMEFKY